MELNLIQNLFQNMIYQVSSLKSLYANQTCAQVLRSCQSHVFSYPGHLHFNVIKELVKTKWVFKLRLTVWREFFKLIKPTNKARAMIERITMPLQGTKIGHFRVPLCLCFKGSLSANYSYENDFYLHEKETACRTHFHMKGFALRLALKQRHKRTRKWPIKIKEKINYICVKGLRWMMLKQTYLS